MPISPGALAERLGLVFDDPALLAEALVHSSFVNEHPDDVGRSNERLEFLGDAVLSVVVSEALFRRYPGEHEGLLTARRAAVVSTHGLARIARRLGIGDALVLGMGAGHAGEQARPSVLAGTFEALVAAVYLDRGLDAVRDFVLRVAGSEVTAGVSADTLKAPKSRLQEYALVTIGRAPSYRIVSAEGPDHDRHFVVAVALDGETLAQGDGRNRREAETMAAEGALARIEALALTGAVAATGDLPAGDLPASDLPAGDGADLDEAPRP